MPLVLLVGGARAGKSRLAQELAAAAGAPVTVVATAEPLDGEMRERIAAHRRTRPAGWRTVEEPLALEEAIAAVSPGDAVVVDCLTLWVANLLGRGDEPAAVERAAAAAAARAAARPGLTVAVTNEVGLGVVPASELGRRYRDLLGAVNRAWADAAGTAALVVAGRALPLAAAGDLLGLARP